MTGSDLYYVFAENFPHATFVFNLQQKKFIYINRAFCSLFAVTMETVNVYDLLNRASEDRDYLEGKFESLLQRRTVGDVDFRIEAEEQQVKWIRLTPLYVKREDEELIFGIASDITGEMSNLHIYKKYSNKKDSILNILAHDLRGPLGVAQMANSILVEKVRDPELAKITATISKVLRQAIELISDLTARELRETTSAALVKKRINITAKLREVMEEYQKTQEATKRVFQFYSSDENIFIDLDEAKFIQVINNVMSNALKFTKEKGVISMRLEKRENAVLFSVADNGIGIPEELQSVLFEKFTAAGRKGLHGEPSLGLGMYVIKTIIEWHNGSIWVDSKENAGTTVYFEIPNVS